MIFQDLIRAEKLLMYPNGFLIANEPLEENCSIFETVLDLMAQNGHHLRLGKCVFSATEIESILV